MADYISKYIGSVPRIAPTDVVEILIISFAIYQVMRWIQSTKAWALFKGIIVLAVFMLFAAIFRLDTILWLVNKTLSVGVIAVIIVFQPELRKALEQIGRQNIFTSLIPFDENKDRDGRFTDLTVAELVKATLELGVAKTGALIVLEKNVSLKEYERTGIPIDGMVTRQLLVNIFEHNTPLHDGAVIIRGDRVAAATCYLPLSDSMTISKELGTRHRAALGISEVSDSLTIIASEETGKISLASEGKLYRNINNEFLNRELLRFQNKNPETKRFKILKGRLKHEKTLDK